MTKKAINSTIQTIFFLLIGVGLCYLLIQKFDFRAAFETISLGSYYNIAPILFISFMSYWFRVQRWRMLMKASAYPSTFANGFMALSIGYSVNYVFPRVGDLTRSFLIKKKEQTPFELTLGTVIVERGVDICALIAVCMIALVLQFRLLSNFFLTKILEPAYSWLADLKHFTLSMMAGLLLAGVLFFSVKKLSDSPRVRNLWTTFITGLLSVKKVTPKWLFLLYTSSIWLCYFLMTYLWTFTFDESSVIGPLAAFVVMVLGTVGRSLPVHGGGIGVYHSIVASTFILYGLTDSTSLALAIIIHGFQAAFFILMCIISYLFLLIKK